MSFTSPKTTGCCSKWIAPPGGEAPALGRDVLCLALLVPSGNTVKANLDAPIVINLHNGRGIQAVSPVAVAGSYRLAENGDWEALC